MKILKYTSAIVLFILTIAIPTSCSDDLTEITKIDYDRVFSPTKLEATILNRTNVRLKWVNNTSTESYTIELFANDSLTFTGSPVLTMEGVTTTENIIENLDGETRYSARVKAVSSKTADSKWTGVFFRTAAEHLLLPFQDGDIASTSVIFRWPAGQQVTEILLTPGNITHTVTPAEVAEGIAIIEGLTGETNYTAKIMNGEKVRATVSFTTLVDIGNATPVYPEDDLITILAAAKDGDAFALFPGTYGDMSKITISKNVEIKAVYPYDKPILKGYISMVDNSAVLLQSIVLDGAGLTDGNQAIVFETAGAFYGDITIENCEIRNHVKGVYYLNVAALVESITINNTLIHHVECNGGDLFDSRTGAIKVLTISNSTIYNSALARDMVRYDNASENFPGVESKIIIDRNTIYNVCNGSSRRLLYIRYTGHQTTFTNNIVASTEGIFSNQTATAVPAFSNNNYFQAPGFLPGGSSSSRFFDESGLQLDPEFENPGEGNFKVNTIDVNAKGMGDPRWLN
ncbi:DUF4957 domain-containing protein [Proteiniphilum acetatigenes]|uniref:DUF4957 domain-containing protein n=1 Tax=Proteiniphilum acetatigenes TaxID=294710 RepID=UPI0003811FD6|nr:DUF4957 domain-containing protein [Proteiniphilum acetatigenes]SFK55239.1 protein of unknown function [Porphyromonadaceae bacterium KH3CP3RA]